MNSLLTPENLQFNYFAAIMMFFIGLYTMTASRNLIRLLIGLEITSKGVMLAFVSVGSALGAMSFVQALIIIMIGVEAVVVATGLILIIRAYKQRGNVDPTKLSGLKG
ncbi:MAG: NADH-quinone oxidoreductase subunit K [Elusimicrobiota bacterium]|jgi:NADH:ubiquinone oxidoreductase subunit K|nr:NADH-quinone oxidoreductase subunit K [Elusimicrobiota bacterium]